MAWETGYSRIVLDDGGFVPFQEQAVDGAGLTSEEIVVRQDGAIALLVFSNTPLQLQVSGSNHRLGVLDELVDAVPGRGRVLRVLHQLHPILGDGSRLDGGDRTVSRDAVVPR